MVKIRLARKGRKKLALFDIVIADSRMPRDGRLIEKLGRYNPNTNPASIEINEDKALDWVMKGVQPTNTVRAILSYKGILIRKHLQLGVQKGAITQKDADAKFQEWKKQKDAAIENKKKKLSKKETEAKKAALEAEAKVKEARAEAIKKKAEAKLKAEAKAAKLNTVAIS